MRPATRARPAERFETSSRYYRGRIVERLRELPEDDSVGIPLASLGPQLREGFSETDLPWLANLVQGLQRDGLAALAEERPGYDDAPELTLDSRIRLP